MPITENASVTSYIENEGATFAPRDSAGNLILPESVSVTAEVPTISTSSSLRVYAKSIGYVRNRFEIQYAPMDKKDAHELLSVFESFKGSGKSFFYPIPETVFNSIAAIQNANGRTMRNMPVFDTFDTATGATTGQAGDDVFVLIDGKVPRFTSNLYVQFTNHDQTYRTVAPGIREADGRVAFKIYPALLQDIDGAGIIARQEFNNYGGYYVLMKVRFDEDEFEYGTNGAGLVVVKYKLVEDL